ncbi:MAG: hypothetical protein EHM28_00955 [Spirochaetaceae bacterium]|nr:MAG: hypothetical protein EHM28_00955 [Spirochaetaceae bacterium]
MNTILCTDSDTSLGLSLVKNLVQQGLSVIAAPSHDQQKTDYSGMKKKPLVISPWNRKSPISAKNVVLQGTGRFKRIDAALILLSPGTITSSLNETRYIDIENAIDKWIKGTIFLTRELLSHFAEEKTGAICLVQHDPEDSDKNTINKLCTDTVVSFMEQSAQEWKSKDIMINRIYSRQTDIKGYADFIVSTVMEKCYKSSGKLFRF